MVDYDTMEAGPELDRLIAEKVMGWQHKTKPFSDRSPIRDYWINSDNVPMYDGMPRFSIDMGAAWIAVEHLRQQRFYVALDEYGNIFTVSVHRGNIDGTVTWFDAAWGNAPTAPLAICHAALKAVEARTDVGKDAGMEENR